MKGPSQAFSLSKASPSNVFFINWNTPAQEISKLHRALILSNQKQPLGVLKLLIGEEIFIVRGLKVMGHRSMAPAGTILTISEKELQITTTTHNLAIYDLYSTDGLPFSITQLAAHHKIAKGYQLKSPDPEFIERFVHAASEYAKHEAFWVNALANIIPCTPPLSVNLKKIKKMEAEIVSFSKVDTTLFTQLLSICDKKEEMNADNPALFTIILMYLYRLNNCQNYTLKFSNQSLYEDKANFKNFFASQLPLSVNFNPEMSFTEALEKTSVTLQQLKENKTYAKDIIFRHPELVINTESNLVSIAVVADPKRFQLSETNALTIVINQKGTEFGLYSRKEAFPDCINTLISNFPSHLMTMMKNIASNLEAPINKLCFLTDSESQKILLDWNNTKIDFPNANKPIHYFFEEQVLKTPHRTAVIFENSSLTYFELNQKANQVAQYLINLNVSPDTLIAICAKRSLEMVIGILGILKSGCGYLPLDPNYPIERLSYMLSDSKSPILLTDTIYSNLKSDITDINCIDIKQILEQTDIVSDSNVKNLVSLVNLAYVIYTSGTTGKPKGVAITHRSLVNHMLWMIPKFNFTENDIFLQKTPFSFDASVWEFFAPLLCGGKLIMASNENPLEITKFIKKHKVTILQLVPSMLRQSLEENEFQTCDSLQQVFSGGEALVPDTVNLFHKKMQAKLHNLYGPTETTIEVTTYSYNRSEEQSIEAVLIGKPIDNAQVYVLDKFHNPVPVGIIGELFIGGACLARGYLNRKDLTQNRFIQNPFDEKTKLYKTGDLVRWLPDGNLEYLNRLDDQVKLHGFRIEMGEIEAALLQHELIRECAVVVQEHANNKGSLGSDKYLVAYYVKKLDLTHSDTEDFIRTWETVYQSEYSSLDINNFKQNTGGWNSSYTDKAIDQEGILEWVDATTDRIKKLKPQVILEIGSGTGLVLFNMIDSCNYYYATDFSKNVIEYTNNVIHKFGYSDKVSTITCTADDLPYTQLEKIYDTVIINSVIQYFPSLEYLETVITKTILNMKNSGQIFIGDVRDFRLLKCFHCSVQTYRREKVTKTEIDYFSSRDKELLVAPEYFIHLKAANKNISHVEILPKLGKANHEMNNYRYDVILHIRKNQEVDKENIDEICINESNFVKMLDFENYVTSNSNNDYICIKYPNKKIAKDYIEYNKLYFNQSISNINDFDNLLTIDQMTEFAKAKNYGAKYFIDVIDPFYLYVIMYKNHISPQKNIFINYINRRSKSDLASKPLAILKLLENQFSNELKEFLSTKIPNYMIPGRYVPLEKLPLTINGKLDRKALTEPEFTRSESYVAPRNELEGQICRIWAEVLGLPEDKIGIQDDFFNLGGHSLSALKTLSLIKNFFLIKLPTRTLFDYPTIEKLAKLVQKTQQALTITTQQSAMISPIIALQENGFKAPLFLIHPIGGTIFWYKALSRYLGTYRSIYAIQDPGIDANDLLFKNVQEMATFYLKAMQKIQPSGPYLLAGASFGATVSIEIANQLLKAGERVNFIGLLDGWPVYSKKFWEKEFFEQLMLQQFERMDLQFISQGINDFQFLLKLQQHRMSMLRDYKIPLIKSKLTFFKAEELWPVFKEMVLPLNCWQPFSTQPVDFHLVPGNHETMFWEPNVQELANKMNESFSKFEIHKQSQRLPLKIQGV